MTEVPVSHDQDARAALEEKYAFLRDRGVFTSSSLEKEIDRRLRTMPSNFSRTRESAMESLMIQVARTGLRGAPLLMATLYDYLNGTNVRGGLEESIEVINDRRRQRRGR